MIAPVITMRDQHRRIINANHRIHASKIMITKRVSGVCKTSRQVTNDSTTHRPS
jgi:ribosomal protein L24